VTVKVSQAGAEALWRVNPGVVASQAGAEFLHKVLAAFSVSQVGAEVLFKASPCGTRWAQIWTITRTDGVVVRLTSKDTNLTWLGHSYAACNSLTPSASENVAEVDQAGSMQLAGAIASGAIDGWDLYAGLFDGATVEVWLVPWAGEGVPKRLLRGNFGQVELGENGFSVDLIGDGARLQQTPLTHAVAPDCRWQFGDQGCGKDLGPLTVTGTVATGDGLRSFTDSARAETPGYFRRGRVTFTSGANAGLSAEIKEHGAGGVFTLWPRVPFPIVAGVAYAMTPGCTNIKDADGGCNGCTAWGQLLRYGGFDKVPGGDKRSATATVKES
jgi:uncharacterized phage protein (TIGR02218 family)